MLSEYKQLSDERCDEDITDSTSAGCEGCLPVYGLGFWTSAEVDVAFWSSTEVNVGTGLCTLRGKERG